MIEILDRSTRKILAVKVKGTLTHEDYEKVLIPRYKKIMRCCDKGRLFFVMDKDFEGYEVAHEFPGIGYRKMLVNGRKIEAGEERRAMILLSFRDVTEQ